MELLRRSLLGESIAEGIANSTDNRSRTWSGTGPVSAGVWWGHICGSSVFGASMELLSSGSCNGTTQIVEQETLL